MAIEIALVAQAAADTAENGGMSQEDLLYYAVMFIAYSGAGSWLIGRLTRTQEDTRRVTRSLISENLGLMLRLSEVREKLPDTERRDEIDEMWNDLLKETAGRIEELNSEEEKEVADPAARYVILPTPRTPLTAILSVLFVACVYVAIGALLVISLAFFRSQLDIFNVPSHLTWFIQVMILSVSLGFAALLIRFACFRLFRRYMARQMQSRADRLVAIREVAARRGRRAG
ncbi:MAG: hypothetical protein AAFV62_00950 [Pseudomonadota bacterium]